MKKRTNDRKKLSLSRQTVRQLLNEQQLRNAVGGDTGGTVIDGASLTVCNYHTNDCV